MKHLTTDPRVPARPQRNSLAARLTGLSAIAMLAGCGVQYRPVVSAINTVGPPGQPTKYAIAVSSPNATSLGLLTAVDFSGDSVISTPQILSHPSYFILNPAGQQGYVINPEGSLNSIPLANPTALITSQIVQTTLPADSGPVSLTALTPSSTIPIIFIPQTNGASIAALNSSTTALFDDIAVGDGGSNPVYVVGSNGTPRVYAISQNAPGSNGQIDALETTSTLQLADSSTIPVGVQPVYGVMTGDNRRAFILNQGSGTVNVVNVSSNALDVTTPLITIPQIAVAGGSSVGPQPVWADLAPTVSDLVVLNQGDGVHPGSLSVIQIPLCNAIAQPTNPNCNSENPIDAEGFGQIVATGTVGIKPTMVSVLQDGTRAYVINTKDGTGICANTPGSDANAGSVSVVNLASGQVTATICGTAAGTAATSIGSTTNLISGHPNSVSATTGTPTGKVYVTSSDSNYLSIIHTDSDSVQAHVNLQGLGLRVLVTAQ